MVRCSPRARGCPVERAAVSIAARHDGDGDGLVDMGRGADRGPNATPFTAATTVLAVPIVSAAPVIDHVDATDPASGSNDRRSAWR